MRIACTVQALLVQLMLLSSACDGSGRGPMGSSGVGGASGAGQSGASGTLPIGGAGGAGGGQEAGSSGGAAACDASVDACSSAEDCVDGCSGHGQCVSAQCECDPAYTGPSCSSCAAGFHVSSSSGRCVSPLCDPDPCVASGKICDNATGSCCGLVCDLGASECSAGLQRTCVETMTGCTDWDAGTSCEPGGCLCPYSDPKVSIEQWGGHGNVEAHGIALAPGGLVLVVGTLAGALPGQTNAGGRDSFVRAQTLTDEAVDAWSLQWGSAGADTARAIAMHAGGDVLVAGEVSGALPSKTAAGAQDGFVTKWNADRTLAWHDQWGTGQADAAYSVALDDDGNVYVAGYTIGDLEHANSGAKEDIVLRKLSASGAEEWTLQLGGATRDYASTVVTNGNDEVWIGGAMGQGPFCRKLDGSGQELWTASWTSVEGDSVTALSVLADGDVIAVGHMGGSSGGSGDAFVARVDADGTILWTKKFGAAPGDYARAVVQGPSGDIYIAGEVNGDLVPGAGAGMDDIFVQRRTLDGDVVWTKQIGTAASERGHGIAVAGDGTVFVTGFTAGSYPGFSGGSRSVVLIKIDP